MKIKVYRRHSQGCKFRTDSDLHRCRCTVWLQYTTGGRTIRRSAQTASLVRAQEQVRDLLAGSPAEPQRDVSIGTALKMWVEFRLDSKLPIEKAKPLADKFERFCDERGIILLEEVTTDLLMQFKATLPYRAVTSSSLKIYWSVFASFFSWARGMKLLKDSPIPDTKIFPAFRIKFKKPEVQVPSAAEVKLVIDSAVGTDKLFLQLLRWSGLAITDAATLRRSQLVGNIITGQRKKTSEKFRVRIPAWLADALRAHECDDPEFFFWELSEAGDKVKPSTVMHRFEGRLRKYFKRLKVTLTPHKFRHFFISEQLAAGVSVDDVSDMVGTSGPEIRRTYKHWLAQGNERRDALQAAVWLQLGLDSNGSELAKPTVN